MFNIPFYRTFHFKLAAAYSLLIAAIIAATGVYSFQAAEEQFRHLFVQDFQSTRKVSNNFLKFVEQTALITANSVATDNTLQELLVVDDPKALASRLQYFMQNNTSDAITLLNNEGRVLARGHDLQTFGDSLLSFDIVRDIINGKKTATAIVQDLGSFILYASADFTHPVTGDPIHILAGYALNNSFVDHVQENSPVEISLVRERSIISTTLLSNNRRITMLPIPFLEYEILLANSGQVMKTHFLGHDYLISAERLPSMQTNMAGSMFLVHSLDELARVKKQLTMRFVLIFVTSLVAGVLLITLLTGNILQPVHQLIQTAEQISGGDLNSRVKIDSKDEFGLLSKQFNIMTSAIQERDHALKQYSQNLEQQVKKRTLSLQEQKEQLERYISAIDDIGVGLCVIDADYCIRTMNKTSIGWFGEQHGNMCYNVIMDQKNPCSDCKLKDVIGQHNMASYQFTRSDERIFEIVATSIYNSDGTTSNIVMIREITEQKRQEEQKLETSRHKEQLNKLESLKTMAGAIAHRFNNAMTAVQGNLDLMLLTLPADSIELKEMASEAAQAAREASQVGSAMLSYVGQQPMKLQTLPLEDLVRDSISALKNLLQSSISLKFTPPDQPLYCSIDQQQIKEVIESILTNAVESMGDGTGTIEITFGTAFFAAASFPVSFQNGKLKDGTYVFCQIKDSGHGISPENLSLIFEPFYSTKFVGRGLGLALTVGIMLSHRGVITFDSSPDKGTTVRILLPFISQTEQTSHSIS